MKQKGLCSLFLLFLLFGCSNSSLSGEAKKMTKIISDDSSVTSLYENKSPVNASLSSFITSSYVYYVDTANDIEKLYQPLQTVDFYKTEKSIDRFITESIYLHFTYSEAVQITCWIKKDGSILLQNASESTYMSATKVVNYPFYADLIVTSK